MSEQKIKFFIHNFNFNLHKQGRISRDMNSFLKNAPHKNSGIYINRKGFLECEIVLDGQTGAPLCRITLPKNMGSLILSKDLPIDMSGLYKITDKHVYYFMRARFPNLEEYNYQIQINNK